ncbi:retrovirus-related pol polyprotein from transposon TNT 1-94, partial [Tanacetum coccineum]
LGKDETFGRLAKVGVALVLVAIWVNCHGFNIESVEYKNINFVVWDFGAYNMSGVTFLNDHELKIIVIGSIMVKMHDGTVRTIRDVRHVEGLKKNLLSLGQLDDLGCKVEIQNKIMKIIKGTLVLMRGEKVAANLYQLKGEIMKETEASVASHSPSHRVAITWHQKLGHMSEQGMKILAERKLLPGLTKVSLPFCEHCVIDA